MTRPTVLLFLRVFVAAGTCLPSPCLATLRGIHFTKQLPRNDTRVCIYTQTDGRDL
jgi:hypothetical protein